MQILTPEQLDSKTVEKWFNKILGLKSYLKDSNMNRKKWSGYIVTILKNRKINH